MHGTAALACAALAARLAGSDLAVSGGVALLVCAISWSALFAVSALYHSAPWTPSWKQRMQRVDHAMIFVKISGTLTPILWIGQDGWLCAGLIGSAWAITVAGAVYTLRADGFDHLGPIALKVAQGCLAIPAFGNFAERVGQGAGELLVLAAACYLAGLATFLTKRPMLFPRAFSFHEVFHVLVLAGSAATLVALLTAVEL
jgi:hemolysin III